MLVRTLLTRPRSLTAAVPTAGLITAGAALAQTGSRLLAVPSVSTQDDDAVSHAFDMGDWTPDRQEKGQGVVRVDGRDDAPRSVGPRGDELSFATEPGGGQNRAFTGRVGGNLIGGGAWSARRAS
ncbi:hypothetical protein [Salinarimonas soli]|uniref:Uncharacterized protein n=1 Tax=Salinarimonas soli TaxID=1638099 RepID=A0A5B2VV95_9HYPH|nr:hypothetical protein [Salinarimonas soli]KAA2242146.1 hypothetical protein F0L46_04065 [Salinarimonas soli]